MEMDLRIAYLLNITVLCYNTKSPQGSINIFPLCRFLVSIYRMKVRPKEILI